ncbi:MAG: hypothetical protein J5910_02930 [Lachnospiraceae bacterium]|nr:hypothetical protein [Lachnospiraceae bacterium]
MMQIGGIDNLVMKQPAVPAVPEQDDKKIITEQADKKVITEQADKKPVETGDDEASRQVYGDVVGKSSDGDTTRVKQDAMEALETGMVFTKDEKDGNLMEFNRDQLNIMREKGDITDHQYDHEITRRDEIMEKDEKSAFAKSNAEMIEKQRKEAEEKAKEAAKERLEEIQNGGKNKEEAAKTDDEKKAEDKNAVNKIAEDKKAEEKKEEEKKEEENPNLQKLENGMNKLAASQGSLRIEEEAVENAAANGRSDVIDQILNPEDGGLKVIIR